MLIICIEIHILILGNDSILFPSEFSADAIFTVL